MCIDTIFAFCGYVDFLSPSLLLGWMFEDDRLDTYCLGVLNACVLYFCICTCSAQLSMCFIWKGVPEIQL